MILYRFIKVGWVISLLVGLASLLYVYAGIPEDVVYSLDDKIIGRATISRESFFYIALAFLAGLNFLLYALSKNMRYKMEAINTLMKNWQLSMAIVLNIFFVITINFIQLVNSGETFHYNHVGYLVYTAIGLVLLWIIALPILMIRTVSLNK